MAVLLVWGLYWPGNARAKDDTQIAVLAAQGKVLAEATRAEDDLLRMDTYGRTRATWSDLARLRAYVGELEAVVEGCSMIPAKPP